MRRDFDRIVSFLMGTSNKNCESLDNPKAIVAIGENGSGKEVVALEAQDELSRQGGSVLIGTEYFKTFTENYLSELKNNNPHIGEKAEKEAEYISNKVLDNAIQNKNNIVVNNPNENQYSLKALTDKLHENGYTVELRAFATPHEHSLIRDMEQKISLKNSLGVGEETEHKRTDPKEISEMLENAEKHNLTDSIKVYDRVGNLTYANEKINDNEWLKNTEAEKSFDFEINKPMQKSEYQYNQVAWQQLVHLKNTLQTPVEQMDHSLKEKDKEVNLDKKNMDDLVVNSPDHYRGVIKGEIVDHDDHDVIVKINRMTAVRYDRQKLNREYDDPNHEHELNIGQQIYINHGSGGYDAMNQQQVETYLNEQKELEHGQNNEHGLNGGHDIEQDLGR